MINDTKDKLTFSCGLIALGLFWQYIGAAEVAWFVISTLIAIIWLDGRLVWVKK